MNNNLNTESIRQLLNRSSAQLGQPTLARLRDVRTQALARYDARSTAPVFVWAGSTATNSGHTSGSHHKSYYWAAAVLLAALLFSGAIYLQHVTEHDNSDVDIAILTDDLPIDVYVE
jgi:hypothetical protein